LPRCRRCTSRRCAPPAGRDAERAACGRRWGRFGHAEPAGVDHGDERRAPADPSISSASLPSELTGWRPARRAPPAAASSNMPGWAAATGCGPAAVPQPARQRDRLVGARLAPPSSVHEHLPRRPWPPPFMTSS
jgi:hypothetical protein